MAIRGVEDYLEPFEKAEIFMLVHGSVRRMSFDVTGDNVSTLTIVACGQQTSSPGENIIIEGTSTFDGTRLDIGRSMTIGTSTLGNMESASQSTLLSRLDGPRPHRNRGEDCPRTGSRS